MLHQVKVLQLLPWLTEQQQSYFSDDELLSHGSDVREWYFSKHVLHLPFPLLLHCESLFAKLCLSSVFVLALPQFSPNTILWWCPGWRCTDRFRNDGSGWETQHMVWQGLHFLPSAAAHVQHPWLAAQRFSFVSAGRNTERILNTCCDHAETIEFDTIRDLVKDKEKYLWFLYGAGCKCVLRGFGSRMRRKQISE